MRVLGFSGDGKLCFPISFSANEFKQMSVREDIAVYGCPGFCKEAVSIFVVRAGEDVVCGIALGI